MFLFAGQPGKTQRNLIYKQWKCHGEALTLTSEHLNSLNPKLTTHRFLLLLLLRSLQLYQEDTVYHPSGLNVNSYDISLNLPILQIYHIECIFKQPRLEIIILFAACN